ncbi:MAG: methylated-DNA--[protein]-cysteine S-methyltransferase [Chlorobi bacterium]|nr:methylated-DNA--[protein]-cysteine S-methyltransferase [Chlorobiota bacterium]
MNMILPPHDEMVKAYLSRDMAYDGVFFTGVRTTGIFCRPTCPGKKPHPEHVEFFASARDALFSGFRPCKRCRPMEPPGTPPSWLDRLLREIEADPARGWTESDLRALQLQPDRVRRWFQEHHGMTFHAYSRARRLGLALGQIKGGASITHTAYDHRYESVSGFNEDFRQILGGSPRDVRSALSVTVSRIPTSLGPMIVCTTEDKLCLLEFADRRALEKQLEGLRRRLNAAITPGSNNIIKHLEKELKAYFDGDCKEFSVPITTPGTPFQQTVWGRLLAIPYGETRSYGEIANEIGNPKSVRAVARANGENRIAIIVPCHRVIGADGSLTGYAGGLWRKQKLLELEGGTASMLEGQERLSAQGYRQVATPWRSRR